MSNKHKGKPVKCSCCEHPLYRSQSQLKKQKNHFCDQICFSKFFSEHNSGKNSKLWKGGDNNNRKKYRELVNKRKLENKQKAIKMLGGICSNCKYDKCIDALEFHHIDPTKKSFDVCRVLGKEWNLEIELEVKKCKLLCSNCHKEHHWTERNA